MLTKKVTVHRQDNPGIRGLVYSSAHQCLFALCIPHGSSNEMVAKLLRLNLRGAEINRVGLSRPILSSHYGDSIEMVEVAGKLIVMPRVTRDGNGYAIPLDTNYVIEPSTGEVLFACKRRPR